jgi:ribosomal protein RSM22 (predicted rRNA methylase)
VVRHPVIRKGHVELQLCTPAGLARVTVGKSQKKRYRAARKAQWADAFQV